MARRKNSTALFEVMHHEKRPPSRAGGSLFVGGGSSAEGGMKSWWPFGKKNADDPTTGSPRVTHVTPIDPAGELDPTAHAEASFAALRIPSAPREIPVSDVPHVSREPGHLDSGPNADAPPATMFNFSVDSEHQLINVRMSYTSAAVAGFALAVAFALAFILGRHGARHAIPALAEQTTQELRRGPAQPGVLDVSPDDSTTTANATTPAGNRIAELAMKGSGASAATRPTAQLASGTATNDPKPPQANVVHDERRMANLNYVVIQNYFDDKKAAEDARDVLLKHGILCSVERGPEGWAPMKWYSVVGYSGFERTRKVPEYDKYIEDIMKVSREYAGTSRFKQFDPQPFKWREAKTAN
jgi:hypothetical protein